MENICRGLILEGIPATGKSTILKKLRKDNIGEKIGCSSSFVYSEEITQRVLEKKYNEGKTNKSDHVKLLDGILSPLENYKQRFIDRGWSDLQFYYIFERFHMTHASYYSYLGWEDFKEFDHRLQDMSAKVCLLTMKEEVFIPRIIKRKEKGEPWQRYISRYGSTLEEIARHYSCQQQEMIDLMSKTNLPSMQLDTTNMDWENIYERVLNFWLDQQIF